MGRVKDKMMEDRELTYEEHLLADYSYDGKGNPQEAAAKQVGGSHYKEMPIQPIEYIVKNSIPYREANVIKYVTRHANKNGLEDIEKAIHYLEMIKEDYVK